ncbi:MAG TPA: DNA cytosine methyltransferase [Trebonia sp.]|jgi:DNA (cytosine-5)-methyltransferase 1|nr:DNA cytosine methyltransferase [Trebonia sp.]
MSLTVIDFFCGAGGSSQGAAAIPGLSVELAANHWDRAIESHAANFPDADHFQGDIHDADAARFPAADLFWASPECPQWSSARGKRREFDRQPDLFGEILPDPAADRSRALMWDVPRYLGAMEDRGRPVLAGVVENVVEVRQWARWGEWLAAIRNLGYDTRLVALNSMHARPAVTMSAPQSRDRLYLTYWRRSLGRTPDWDKHLRPMAWCPQCEEWVRAVQWWKRPGADMGRYRQSYLYRCPHVACRNAVLEPPALPAATAIDWDDLGTRIGDRARPMRDATRARIAAGLARFARPVTLETTWSGDGADSRTWPTDVPLSTQTAQQTKALACPAMLVPAGGTWRADPASASVPFPSRTTRENDGVAFPPGALLMRNNTPRGDPGQMVTPVTEPARTITTAGHQSLLVPYYGKASAQSPELPAGTMTTRDRYGLASGTDSIPVDDVLFRMLKPPEIGRAMAFGDTYRVLGTQRERVRQYGNAVTPPVAEVLFSALVEAITPEVNLAAA